MSAKRALCEHSAVVSSTQLPLTMKPCITTTKLRDCNVWTGNTHIYSWGHALQHTYNILFLTPSSSSLAHGLSRGFHSFPLFLSTDSSSTLCYFFSSTLWNYSPLCNFVETVRKLFSTSNRKRFRSIHRIKPRDLRQEIYSTIQKTWLVLFTLSRQGKFCFHLSHSKIISLTFLSTF